MNYTLAENVNSVNGAGGIAILACITICFGSIFFAFCNKRNKYDNI
jgi:hypothetical protein